MNTVAASSNDTPCFRTLVRAFAGSHKNCTPAAYDIRRATGATLMSVAPGRTGRDMDRAGGKRETSQELVVGTRRAATVAHRELELRPRVVNA